MEAPKYAIKTLHELAEVLKTKPSNIYLSPCCRFDGKVLTGVTSLRTTGRTELRDHEIVGLEGVSQNIIFCDNPLQANASGAFIFTNYWHAFAHAQQRKQEKK